jgi:hypothetical protein
MTTLEVKTLALKNHWNHEEWVSIEFRYADMVEPQPDSSNPMLIIDSPTGKETFTFSDKEEAVKYFKDCLKILGWNE